MASFLQGVRVIDLSHWWAGPYATMALANMGAEIIKVESIQRVDGYRGGYAAQGQKAWERAPTFLAFNLGKLDVTLDLNRPQGKELLLRLFRVGDVVIENYSARVMANFGLSYENMRKENPTMIYVSMPGFGSTGPWRDYTGFAFNLEQLSGIAHHTGFADGPPSNIGAAADPIMGLYGAFAVMTALEHRLATGEGQLVDLAHLEALTTFAGAPVLERQLTGCLPSRTGNLHPSAAPHGFYPCKGDDQWVAIAVYGDADWERLTAAMGNPTWARDERYADQVSRWNHRDALDGHIGEWTQGMDKHQATALLQQAGVAAGAANDARDLTQDEQLKSRGFFQRMDHEEVGPMPYPRPSYLVDDKPVQWTRPAPTLGQDNRQVLQDLLGVSPSELSALERDGIIGTTPLGS